MRSGDHPLDLQKIEYAYIERPNSTLISLFERRVAARTDAPVVLDVGCGAGATARAILAAHPRAVVYGVEPNARAAALAAEGGVRVFHGDLAGFVARSPAERFDAVILGDVLEHAADPVAFLRALLAFEPASRATFLISVPNVAVWHARARAALGIFEYAESGVYDRTHLRFFTQKSLLRLLEYLGLRPLEARASPSLVQPIAPVLRRLFFERKVEAGEHLELTSWASFRMYTKVVEPVEAAICNLWPSLLGFQIVVAAEAGSR